MILKLEEMGELGFFMDHKPMNRIFINPTKKEKKKKKKN